MRYFRSSIIILLTLALSPHSSQAAPPANEVLRAITQESRWLNTSRALTVDDLKGRVILLDFWTYCCINCMHIIPDLHRLEKEFGRDLTVIGVHSAKFTNEKDSDNIRSAIQRYEIEHAVVNDSEFKIWKALGVESWPTLILISADGEIAHVYSGEGHYDDLKKAITKLRGHNNLNRQPLPYALEKNKIPPSLLKFPSKMAYASDLKLLFVSDSNHNRIVAIKVDDELKHPESAHQIAFTIGQEQGNKDGTFATSQFNQPQGLLYKKGLLYIADTQNHVLKRADLLLKTVTTIAGTGVQGFDREPDKAPALTTSLSSPWDLAFYPDDQFIAIAMAGTHQLWSYSIRSKTLSAIAGSGRESIEDGEYPDNSLSQPSGLSPHGNRLYFVDSETSSLRILEKGLVRTFVGTGLFDFGFKDGKKGVSRLQHPLGVYADDGMIFIADSYNHSIRKFDLSNGNLETVVGSGKKGDVLGSAAEARLNEPAGITRVGTRYVITDTNNHEIKVWDPQTHAVQVLNIIQNDKKLTNSKRKLADFLPQLRRTETLKVGLLQTKAKLVLESGWHINEAAPSWLALFDVSTAKPQLVKEFTLSDLKKNHVILPKLKIDGTYRLQGTLYYCSEDKGAVCLIRSTDQVMEVDGKGMNAIEILLDRKKVHD